jgi:hypothetical protein
MGLLTAVKLGSTVMQLRPPLAIGLAFYFWSFCLVFGETGVCSTYLSSASGVDGMKLVVEN